MGWGVYPIVGSDAKDPAAVSCTECMALDSRK